MGRRIRRTGKSRRDAKPGILLRSAVLATTVGIVLASAYLLIDAPESQTLVTGTVTGVYQRPNIYSDVPSPVELLVHLESGERIQATLSSPAPFRPGRQALLTKRTMKYGPTLYRFERYLEPEQVNDPLSRPSNH
jgi:hypothetical protein